MAYSHKNSKGKIYYLHQKGKLMFFSANPADGIDLPVGFVVVENTKTGLPLLKRK